MKFFRSTTLGLICLAFLASCSKVEPPQFRKIGAFQVKKLGFQQADIGLSVTYFNPNNFGVTVKEAAVDVYLDTVYMGKFVQPQEVQVDKKADFSIPLEGGIPLSKALQLNFKDALDQEIKVKAMGTVRVGKAGVYITRDINYEGKHKVDIRL
jgi:LEA14-like dessication related protein